VKIFLHTIRYGIEQTFEYHGSDYFYDSADSVLTVASPVEENGHVGLVAIVTICAGDRMLVVACEPDCDLHKVGRCGCGCDSSDEEVTTPNSARRILASDAKKMVKETWIKACI
jgi:hypothetical protein